MSCDTPFCLFESLCLCARLRTFACACACMCVCALDATDPCGLMMQQLLILLDWIGSNALNHMHKTLASIGKNNDVTCMTLALGTHGIVAVPSVQMCVRHGSQLSCWILPG